MCKIHINRLLLMQINGPDMSWRRFPLDLEISGSPVDFNQPQHTTATLFSGLEGCNLNPCTTIGTQVEWRKS